MSFLTSLLLLLLCLSMHACHGRHLHVVNKASGTPVRHSVNGEEKATFNENLIPSEVNTSLQSTNKNGTVDEGLGGATTSIQKAEVKEAKKSDLASVTQEESLVLVSWSIPRKKQGSEISLSSDVGFQQSTKIQVDGRRAQSVLGSESYVNDEGNIDSKEKGSVENVVVMDYESPHRKPPIHNLSP